MRVIVASENKSTRDAIGMLIRVQSDLELAGEVEDITELLSKIKSTGAALVVLDWDVLGQQIDVLLDLLELFDDPPSIVALSVREGARADAAGVARFAFKGDPPDRLLEAIRISAQERRASAQERRAKSPNSQGYNDRHAPTSDGDANSI